MEGAARARLNALLQLADATTLLDQIRLLVDYHGRVMADRGQQPWLMLDDKGVRCMSARCVIRLEENWPQGVWYNSYYLAAVQMASAWLSGGSGVKLLAAFKEQIKALGPLRYIWLTSFNINIEFIETYLLPVVMDMGRYRQPRPHLPRSWCPIRLGRLFCS